MAVPWRDDARREDAGTISGVVGTATRRAGALERENGHAGIVVVDDLAVRSLLHQRRQGGPQPAREFLDDLPLCRRRQRSLQVRAAVFTDILAFCARVLATQCGKERRA